MFSSLAGIKAAAATKASVAAMHLKAAAVATKTAAATMHVKAAAGALGLVCVSSVTTHVVEQRIAHHKPKPRIHRVVAHHKPATSHHRSAVVPPIATVCEPGITTLQTAIPSQPVVDLNAINTGSNGLGGGSTVSNPVRSFTPVIYSPGAGGGFGIIGGGGGGGVIPNKPETPAPTPTPTPDVPEQVASVPEPTTWISMVTGIAIMGAVMRNGRNRRAVVA